MESIIQIIVYGKVQGVFFRKYTYETAVQLGIKGYVRNQSDGSVLILAQGENPLLKKLIDWTKTGSPKSKVDRIEWIEKGSGNEFKNFEIR